MDGKQTNPQAALDGLTGLWRGAAFQEKVALALASTNGAMIILKIEFLRQINERCGHLIGDRVLQEAAKAVSSLFWARDIVGRVEGTRFAVFISGSVLQEMVENKYKQLSRWFQRIGLDEGIASGIATSFGVAFSEPGDTVQSLLERAEQNREKKTDGKLPLPRFTGRKVKISDEEESLPLSLRTDMARIRDQLSEKKREEGAYCPDYESFQCIYRFVERGLERSINSAYVILLTLQQGEEDLPAVENRPYFMEKLQDNIRFALRRGDVFTQYTSGQYILMVLGTDEKNAWNICQRIIQKFVETVEDPNLVLLQGNVYPVGKNRE